MFFACLVENKGEPKKIKIKKGERLLGKGTGSHGGSWPILAWGALLGQVPGQLLFLYK